MMRAIFLPIGFASALFVLGMHVAREHPPAGRTEPWSAPATREYANNVAGVGLVEPKSEAVSVGASSAGRVEVVFVKEGEQVAPGSPLFRLESGHFAADLAIKEQMLASAKAQLARLEAMPRTEELPPSLARIAEARANLDERRDAAERAEQLYRRKAIGEEEWVRRKKSMEAAKALYERAEAEHQLLKAGAWKPDLAVSRASVELAQAQVDLARVDLERRTIRAPLSAKTDPAPAAWTVLEVNVRSGEFVATPSQHTLVMLGDLSRFHVRVDIDEHDAPRFSPRASASAKVRGANENRYSLEFVRVEPYVRPKRSLTGDSVERIDTRVLRVIYCVAEKQPAVYVGQQMDVFINAEPTAPAPTAAR